MGSKTYTEKESTLVTTSGTRSIAQLLTQCCQNVSPIMFHLKLLMDVMWVTIRSIPDILVAFYYVFISKPKKDVAKEIVLVTGSGQGLGRELCLSFAKLGSEIVCVDIVEENNLETVRQIRAIGAKARSFICNVADRAAVIKLAEQVGRVDILINNAGVYPVKGLWNASELELRTIMDINLMSQFWTVQAFMPGMKQRDHGHVVSISSMAGLIGLAYLHPYAVSKAGLSGLMQSLDHELRLEKRSNIKLTTVYPYFIKTRHEITDCVELRVPALEVDVAVQDIVRGIREELISFTVPRDLAHAMNLTNIYPKGFSDRWYELFFATVNEPDEDLFKIALEKGDLDHTGTIKVQ